jgi:hypothetical protein
MLSAPFQSSADSEKRTRLKQNSSSSKISAALHVLSQPGPASRNSVGLSAVLWRRLLAINHTPALGHTVGKGALDGGHGFPSSTV